MLIDAVDSHTLIASTTIASTTRRLEHMTQIKNGVDARDGPWKPAGEAPCSAAANAGVVKRGPMRAALPRHRSAASEPSGEFPNHINHNPTRYENGLQHACGSYLLGFQRRLSLAGPSDLLRARSRRFRLRSHAWRARVSAR